MGYFSWLCPADESLLVDYDDAACDKRVDDLSVVCMGCRTFREQMLVRDNVDGRLRHEVMSHV